MLKRLLPLLLLVLVSPACAQFAYVPIQQSNGKITTGTCIFNQNVTSGNIIIVGAMWFNSANTPSISDTRSSTWSRDLWYNLGGAGGIDGAVFSTTLGSSGAETITVTVSGAADFDVSCAELPPVFSLTVDATDTTTGTSGTPTSGTLTTSLNHDFIFATLGLFHSGDQIQAGSGYTLLAAESGDDAGALEVKIAGNNGSYTSSFVCTSDIFTLLTVAYKPLSINITSPTALPDAALTKAYTYTELGDGGAGAYTWSIVSGALPAGMSINSSTGAITGTPTISNHYSFTVQVTDGTHTTTKAHTIAVATGLNTASVLQSKTNGPSDIASLAFTSNVTAGSMLVAVGGYGSTNTGAGQYCTDTLGTVFQMTRYDFYYPTSVNDLPVIMQVFAGKAPSSGADTITCLNIRSILELANAQYFGNDNSNFTTSNTASPISSSSLTTLVVNEILVSAATGYTATTTLSASAPFTGINDTRNSDQATQVVTTVTGYTSSYTMASNTDGHWGISLLGFRPASNGIVTPPNLRHRTIFY